MLALWNLPALNDWRTARNRMEATQTRVDQQKTLIAKLEKERDAIAVDRQALERAAREEYLLLRPGEQVYVFQERRSTR
jgi:cell division protein FtsB